MSRLDEIEMRHALSIASAKAPPGDVRTGILAAALLDRDDDVRTLAAYVKNMHGGSPFWPDDVRAIVAAVSS